MNSLKPVYRARLHLLPQQYPAVPMGGDSRFRAGGWERTMDLLANLPSSNDSLKSVCNPMEKSQTLHVLAVWRLFSPSNLL